MSVLVATDTSWDNSPMIKKRLESLKEGIIVNAFYGKQLKIIQRYCLENMLHLFRRSIDSKNKEVSILNVLEKITFVIVFTNFIEYNTISSFLIEACELNDIPFFIFRENDTGFLFNNEYHDSHFKKIVKTLVKKDTTDLRLKLPSILINTCENKTPESINIAIEHLRRRYSGIEENKSQNSIEFLFNKDEQKKHKQNKKSAKEAAYLNYEKRRNLWIKEIVSKR